MHIIGVNPKGEVEVIENPVDHSAEITRLDNANEQLTSSITDNCESGFKEDGSFQTCQHGTLCSNTQMDDSISAPQFYCAAERARRNISERRKLRIRNLMLDFYWNSNKRSDALGFLRDSDLVTSYQY
jgi:hypothetical protein